MSSIGPVGGGYSAILARAAARRAQQTGGGSSVSSATRHKLPVADTKSFDPGAASVGRPVQPASTGLQSFVEGVHESQAHADKMVIDLASGQDVNIHNTMVELEKADIALKYTVQLRNRALSAYEELMRMQV